MSTAPQVRIGIGGWNYAPWRGRFYPAGWVQREELAYASRHVTAIEINSTYYGTQKPATFARWRDEVPDDFVFTLKASRYATQRKQLAQAGDTVQRFLGSGIAELGPKLGPIVWQFPPTKAFDPEDFAAFLELLPPSLNGMALRHVLDVRHPSFMDPAYLALARAHRMATVFTDSDEHPSFADLTAPDLVYLRLMKAQPDLPAGYRPAALKRWAEAAQRWAQGGEPSHLPRVEPLDAKRSEGTAGPPRQVFVYFINGAKENAPAAAQALLATLDAASRKAASPR